MPLAKPMTAKLREDLELIEGVYPEFNELEYLDGKVAPVFFGSALNTFGVKELLDCFVRIAPSPKPTLAEERTVEPGESTFSGFVFKIHANMDPNHRSCIAFVKVLLRMFQTQCQLQAHSFRQIHEILITNSFHGTKERHC